MSIDFNCPSCHAGLSVKQEFAGKNANCPQCGKPFTVPNASTQPAESNPLAGLNINTGAKPVEAPAPSSTTAAPMGAPQTPTKPTSTLAAAQPGGAYASPGVDVTRDAGSSGEPRRRAYPALTLAVTIYTVLSYLILVMGALSMLGALGYGVVTIGGLPGIMVSLGASAVVVLYTFMLWISLKAAAEFIKLAMNIEHDTHRMAESVQRRG